MEDGSMETWALIWKIMFILVLIVFAGMSVWITVGGWRDIRRLLEKLRGKDEHDETPSP